MKIYSTEIPDVKIVEPDVFGDSRGWFYESYSLNKFTEHGIDTVFVQDNRSYSAEKGTLRGLHFQKTPMAQTKLVSCTRGEILDVAVDLRKDSETYLKWVSVVLSAENKKMLYVPKGFAHGFLTLTEDVEVLYKVDNFYSYEHDRSIRFDDKEIGVKWEVENPVLSAKDKNAPLLKDSDCDFTLENTK